MRPHNQQFLELFLEHQPSLFAFVLSRGVRGADADDVLQNIAGVLWKKFDSYQQGTNFKAWAFAVSVNEVKSYYRKAKHGARLLRLDEEVLEKIDDIEVSGSPQLVDFRKDLLVKCLSKLKDTARKLIKRYYRQESSPHALAQEANLTDAGLRVQVYRIRKTLKDCVELEMQRAAG